MLYLEDYLEMIEHLPQELRDRFTEMRELDLTVQNNMDNLEKKTRTFFMQCKRGELQEETVDAEFHNLRKEYMKVLEDADEKVNIATQIHDLVERYLRRLDTELFKFKCELEADNNGITEILEKRSLEMDGSSSAAVSLLNVINQKENRYYGTIGMSTSSNNVLGVPSASLGIIMSNAPGTNKDNRYRTPKAEKRRDSSSNISSLPEKRSNLGNSLTPGSTSSSGVRPITPSINAHTVLNSTVPGTATPGTPSAVAYNLQHLGGSASNAIVAAASQAIVATQQMQQGRRTASLKASYEAIHGAGGGPTEFWISRDITNASSTATQNTGSEKKHKRKSNVNHSHSSTTAPSGVNSSTISIASTSSSVSVDSVDMMPTSSGVGGVSGLNLNNASSTSTVGNRGGSSSSSSSSSALALGTNLTVSENGLVVDQAADGDWSYDPNEPRYCTCNQVSYGDMVACDNDACPYEWFHYPCVGITQPPKGKWYCPKCIATMRRRGNRKN